MYKQEKSEKLVGNKLANETKSQVQVHLHYTSYSLLNIPFTIPISLPPIELSKPIFSLSPENTQSGISGLLTFILTTLILH